MKLEFKPEHFPGIQYAAADLIPIMAANMANNALAKMMEDAPEVEAHQSDGRLSPDAPARVWWRLNESPFGHTPTMRARLVNIEPLDSPDIIT